LSANAAEEDAPRDDEPFDYDAKPEKFYFEVETDGSLGPQEVVMKVCRQLSFFFFPLFFQCVVVALSPMRDVPHRALPSCRRSSPISFSD
jgi:hypothetical protein